MHCTIAPDGSATLYNLATQLQVIHAAIEQVKRDVLYHPRERLIEYIIGVEEAVQRLRRARAHAQHGVRIAVPRPRGHLVVLAPHRRNLPLARARLDVDVSDAVIVGRMKNLLESEKALCVDNQRWVIDVYNLDQICCCGQLLMWHKYALTDCVSRRKDAI